MWLGIEDDRRAVELAEPEGVTVARGAAGDAGADPVGLGTRSGPADREAVWRAIVGADGVARVAALTEVPLVADLQPVDGGREGHAVVRELRQNVGGLRGPHRRKVAHAVDPDVRPLTGDAGGDPLPPDPAPPPAIPLHAPAPPPHPPPPLP